ncbi:hypothetical protein [Mesorhizobium sp. 10J20-29]
MQIDKTGSAILNILGSRGDTKDQPSAGASLASLSNQQASSRLGIRPGTISGQYRPIYETQSRSVERDVYEARALSRTEDTFEEREVVGTEDIYEDRDVIETRDIHETRAVYGNRDVWQAEVQGDKRLDDKKGLSDAKIDIGADFSVTVGDGAKVVLTFASSSRISVTQGGATQNFTYDNTKGSLGNALVAVLDSVAGLHASLDSSGKLNLKVAGQMSLSLADVANGFLDFSRSPLDKLGFEAGTTQAQVIGTEWAQIGTEDVVVGKESVVVGTERVKTGERDVILGTEHVKIGEQLVVTGMERVKTGTISQELAGVTKLVGLVDTGQAGGLGALNLLDRLARGGLPVGYLEALFSPLDTNENAGANDPKAIEAYRTVNDDAWSITQGDSKPNRWLATSEDK